MKHSSAPWDISDGSIWAISPFNARVRIADIKKHAPANGINSEANAALIAAAPELLEALKCMAAMKRPTQEANALLEEAGWDSKVMSAGDFIWDRVYTAIYKAEGK